MTKDSIRGSSDRSILILTSLASCPRHGYALIKDIEEFAGVKLGAGTLYGALAKLEREGLVLALPRSGAGRTRSPRSAGSTCGSGCRSRPASRRSACGASRRPHHEPSCHEPRRHEPRR